MAKKKVAKKDGPETGKDGVLKYCPGTKILTREYRVKYGESKTKR